MFSFKVEDVWNGEDICHSDKIIGALVSQNLLMI